MAGTSASGRRGKGTAAHVVAGTFRSDRHGSFETPEPPKGRPEPPKPLDGDALAEWGRMIARLEQTGALSVVDDAVVYQYCRLWAETEEQAERPSEFTGSISLLEQNLRDLKGAELVACFQEIGKLHALRAQNETKVRQGRMAIRQYLSDFGMSPAARSRVKLPAKKTQSKVEQFRAAKAGA